MFTTKTFGKIIWIASILLVSVQLNAQDKNKKVSFEVKGNCGMCKARIEKAALKVKGVKYVLMHVLQRYLK